MNSMRAKSVAVAAATTAGLFLSADDAPSVSAFIVSPRSSVSTDSVAPIMRRLGGRPQTNTFLVGSPLFPSSSFAGNMRSRYEFDRIDVVTRISSHLFLSRSPISAPQEQTDTENMPGRPLRQSQQGQVRKREVLLNMFKKRKMRRATTPSSQVKKRKRKRKPIAREILTVAELEDAFANGPLKKRKSGETDDEADGMDRDVDDDDDEDDGIDEDVIDYDEVLRTISVKGDTQLIGSQRHPDKVHPVLKLLHERRKRLGGGHVGAAPGRSNDAPGDTSGDGFKVVLSIEGGGMRGCVSAGMVAAIHHLGLHRCFDVVYGSSAGSLIGAYLITEQLPWFGPEVYYDALTCSGKKFIDTRRLLRAVGLGLLDPRLLKDVLTRREQGKPVLDLSYLLTQTIQESKPLDWETFRRLQAVQPLKIIASGLKSERAVVFDMENGAFDSLEGLACCMHASMLLPGIAGPVMNIGPNDAENRTEHVIGNNVNLDCWEGEPLADALIYEPLPYRSAIEEGATHVVVLRTRPDGVDVTGKPGVFDKRIMRRFFLKKNNFPNIFRRMRRQEHKKLYGEDVLVLNEAANKGMDRDYRDTTSPHLMAIALPPGSPEITRLEMGRKEIFEGVRRGFARAYDALVEDPAERGRGHIVAKQYFPDEILDYDPLEVEAAPDESAFEAYLRHLGVGETEANVKKSKSERVVDLPDDTVVETGTRT